MADSSVGTSTMNSVVCVTCGLDLKETPKLRNLGLRHKGCTIEICKRVIITWKELTLILALTIHRWSFLIPEDSLKMCRTYFNDYDKFAVKQAGSEKKLRTTLFKLHLAVSSIVLGGQGQKL